MSWEKGAVSIRLLSARKQQVTLHAPSSIESASVSAGTGTTGSSKRADTRTVMLPAGQEVTIELKLK